MTVQVLRKKLTMGQHRQMSESGILTGHDQVTGRGGVSPPNAGRGDRAPTGMKYNPVIPHQRLIDLL